MIAARRLAVGRGRARLLAEVSFSVPGGECWAIVGRNGSGKSTLLATLAGLIPPFDGEVAVLGKALRDWRRPALALHLGFLPQVQPTVFPYTVEEFVGLGRVPWGRAHGRRGPAFAAALDTALDALALQPLRSRPVTALSGGEAQRVCIAQLLAQATDILLLDEPLAHLDLLHQVGVMSLLRGVADQGHAVAVATHDLPLAWRFCDRLLVLGPGGVRVVERRDPEQAAAALGGAFEVEFEVDAHGPRLAAADPSRRSHGSE